LFEHLIRANANKVAIIYLNFLIENLVWIDY